MFSDCTGTTLATPAQVRASANPGDNHEYARPMDGCTNVRSTKRRWHQMRRPCYEFLAGCLALVAGFWFVWIDAPFIELRGFQIPGEVGNIVDFLGGIADEDEASWKTWSLWTLYLVPVAGLFGAALEVWNWRRGGNWWWMRLAVGSMPVLSLVVVGTVFATRRTWFQGLVEVIPEAWLPSPLEILQFGFWLTLAGVLACLASVFTLKRKEGAATRTAPPDAAAG